MSGREDIGVPDSCAFVVALGVSMAVMREGSGPPLVCLHAVGHGGGDFDALTAALRDRFEIIRLDWPGQGRSGEDHQPASARRYADLLGAVLDQLGVERPLIVGNSIGGAAAILHAERAPVRGLVLCDPGGLVAVDGTVRRVCRLFAAAFRAGARGTGWYPLVFSLYYGSVLPGPGARRQRRRIVAAGRELAPVLAQAWASFGEPDADLRGVAAGLDVPVWFAWARGDRVIPLSRCRTAIAAMKRATVSLFPGGHAPFLEAPEAFLAGFERYLAVNRL